MSPAPAPCVRPRHPGLAAAGRSPGTGGDPWDPWGQRDAWGRGSARGGAEEEPSLAPLYQARARHRALFAAVTSPGRSNGEGWGLTPNHAVLGEFRHFSPPCSTLGLGGKAQGELLLGCAPLTCPSPVLFPDDLHGQGRKGRCCPAALLGARLTVGPPRAHFSRHLRGLQRTALVARHARP